MLLFLSSLPLCLGRERGLEMLALAFAKMGA